VKEWAGLRRTSRDRSDDSCWKGSVYTIIFDGRTFAPLGMNWTGVSGPMKGTHNGEVVLKTAIVDRTPPLP